MHPGVQDEALASRFEVITVRADLRAAGEIDEFQQPEDERGGLTRAMRNMRQSWQVLVKMTNDE
jgi:hypothetical protein